jgi:4-amino-4-deoxy-L-arabinose transferase-like glycosyltransferase
MIYVAIVFYLLSLGLYEFSERRKLSVFMLFSGCFAIGLYVCSLDHFLHFWDESFHALVAKNMIQNPLKPMLRLDAVIPNNYKDWLNSTLWLHKQPLFMWQMALSIKLFGVNEVAARIPSLTMVAMLVFPIYRMGKITVNERVGYYSAFLFSLSYYVHELATGFWPTDHNDIAFVFYVTCSIWAFIEYEKSGSRKWILLIGYFVGCALLVKWLMGLMIYGGWGVSILFDMDKRMVVKNYIDILLSLIITAIVVLPWQIYTWVKYPIESWYEYHYAKTHFTEGLDGHTGNALFHFNGLKEIYGHGDLIPYLMIVALILLLMRIKNKTYRIVFLFNVIAVYTFYTVANTKMVPYCLIVSSIFYIALGSLLNYFFVFADLLIKRKVVVKLIITATLLIVGFADFNYYKIHKNHVDSPENKDTYTYEVTKDTKVIKDLPNKLDGKDYVLFNCKKMEHLAILFYTGFNAYDFIPEEETVKSLERHNIKMAFNDNGKLPEYILNDSSIVKIKMDAGEQKLQIH